MVGKYEFWSLQGLSNDKRFKGREGLGNHTVEGCCVWLIMSTFFSSVLSSPKQHILDASKLIEFAYDNFNFVENGGKLSKQVEKHCGKRRNCSLRAISPFPTVFSKDLSCRHVITRACLGKG